MFILTKNVGMKNTWFFLLIIMIKITFLTKGHIMHLIKKDNKKNVYQDIHGLVK